MSWYEGYTTVPLGPGDKDYAWITKKMQKTIRTHNGNTIAQYNIIALHKVKNASLWGSYTKRRHTLYKDVGHQVEELRLFHGTEHADAIMEHGFKIEYADLNGMFGKGIYFSDLSSKSNQYTFEGYNNPCKDHMVVMCTQCVRKMLVCRVAMGKKYEAHQPMNGIVKPPTGYHSVIANPKPGFLAYPEFVIYNSNQAYPGYMVEYKIRVN